MKQCFFLICFLEFITVISVSAQDMQSLNALPLTAPKDTIDYAGLRCMYRQLVMNDTLNPRKLEESYMLLQTGRSVSKYFNYANFYTDSVLHAEFKINPEQDFMVVMQKIQAGPSDNDRLQLFKNYPAHKNTSINNIFTDKYIFEEDMITPKWVIGKQQKTILGYQCTQATTIFFGRHYEAWFAPKIPVSDGPWKFTGLPGLILQVYDKKRHYSFECIQIKNVSEIKEPIYIQMKSKSLLRTKKETYFKQLKNYMDNPRGTASTSEKLKLSEQTLQKMKKRPYNPIELSGQ